MAEPPLSRVIPPTPSTPLGLLNGRGVETARWQGLPDVLQVVNVLQDLFNVPVVGLYCIILLLGFSLKKRHFLVQVIIFHLVFGTVQGTFNFIQFVQVHCLQLSWKTRSKQWNALKPLWHLGAHAAERPADLHRCLRDSIWNRNNHMGDIFIFTLLKTNTEHCQTSSEVTWEREKTQSPCQKPHKPHFKRSTDPSGSSNSIGRKASTHQENTQRHRAH